jgi:membrane associated rhomboid family serine protease
MAPPLRRPWPATFPVLPCAGLLAFASVAGFAVVVLVPSALPTLALVPAELGARPWAALTYSFVHPGPLSLLANLAVLLLIAPRLEARIGGARLAGYFAGGALTGVVVSLAQPGAAMAGAGTAIFGVLVGFARHCPDEAVVPPLRLTGRWPVAALAAAVLLLGLSGLPSGVGRGAVVGVMVVGLVLAARPVRRLAERQVELPNSHFNMPGVTHDEISTPWDSIDLDSLHEVNRSVVEVLLLRARELGPTHLSPAERELLDRMTFASELARQRSGG